MNIETETSADRHRRQAREREQAHAQANHKLNFDRIISNAIQKGIDKNVPKSALLEIVSEWQTKLAAWVAEEKLRASGQ